jgi:hypothetical protein
MVFLGSMLCSAADGVDFKPVWGRWRKVEDVERSINKIALKYLKLPALPRRIELLFSP